MLFDRGRSWPTLHDMLDGQDGGLDEGEGDGGGTDPLRGPHRYTGPATRAHWATQPCNNIIEVRGIPSINPWAVFDPNFNEIWERVKLFFSIF